MTNIGQSKLKEKQFLLFKNVVYKKEFLKLKNSRESQEFMKEHDKGQKRF